MHCLDKEYQEKNTAKIIKVIRNIQNMFFNIGNRCYELEFKQPMYRIHKKIAFFFFDILGKSIKLIWPFTRLAKELKSHNYLK